MSTYNIFSLRSKKNYQYFLIEKVPCLELWFLIYMYRVSENVYIFCCFLLQTYNTAPKPFGSTTNKPSPTPYSPAVDNISHQTQNINLNR